MKGDVYQGMGWYRYGRVKIKVRRGDLFHARTACDRTASEQKPSLMKQE